MGFFSPQSIEQAVFATLAYFDILSRPLTVEELQRYLYGWSADEKEILGAIENMREVAYIDGICVMQGREELLSLHKANEPVRAALWKRVNLFRPLLAVCPFIRMAAVVNSLALRTVHKESDIDLFIIARAGRLWQARLWLKALTQLFGVRAHGRHTAGRFCVSFAVTEDALDIGFVAHPFDPHLAYFVRTAVPIFGSDMYVQWIEANAHWLRNYFPKLWDYKICGEKIAAGRVAGGLRKSLEIPLRLSSGLAERIARALQLRKDRARQRFCGSEASIIISDKIYKFHERDTRAIMSARFSKASRLASTASELPSSEHSERTPV